MTGRKRLIRGLLGGSVLAAAWFGVAPAAEDPLKAGFISPPNSARPRVWWHWMNGNITRDGIRKDIAWMKRVGIGGLQNFDAALTTPQIVEHRLVYMTPEWKAAFRYAASLAEEKGLEFAVAASPGWSETGGPWVPPQDGMKKLVWSETMVEGGRPFDGVLAAPPRDTGGFQDALAAATPAVFAAPGKEKAPPVFYADAAVVAFPVRASVDTLPQARTDRGAMLDAALLADGRLQTGAVADRGSPDAPGIVTLSFDAPRTIRSASVAVEAPTTFLERLTLRPRLEASDDGTDWRRIAEFPVPDGLQTTASFPPVTASRFRLVFADTAPADAGRSPASVTIQVRELRLSGEPAVDRFESKAGFTIVPDYDALQTKGSPDERGTPPDQVIDLTGRMSTDGRLDWTPPAGNWIVLRLGYSLTGTTNHPATAEATGLEVDKYDGAAVDRYLSTYLAMFRETTGPDLFGARGLKALLTDSIEVGPSNWTPAILDRFQALRGYDPRPWLPALTGRLIGTRTQSDAFLYDWRRTLADLIAEQHYRTVATVARRNGLVLYGEALEDGRPVLGDDIAMRSHADIPMAALWTYPLGQSARPTMLADMKGAASAAHLYGRPLAAAESMTSLNAPWAFAPSDLKRIVDLEFAYGINRVVVHTSVHQPMDDKQPGLSLLIFGQYFNRHETWAEMAGPWVDYIARSSFLLQQGRYVADVAYFYGEETPLTGLYGETPVADAPTRHGYDFVGVDAVLNLLRVDGGDLITPSGMRYRVLYLGGSSRRMTLPVLRRIAALAEDGATIVGHAPAASPSLKDDPAEFQALVTRLWGAGGSGAGKGRILDSSDVEAALATMGVAPDFAFEGAAGDESTLFLHRTLADGEIYFVTNRRDQLMKGELRLRVTGRTPEIWRADTGRSEAVSYRIENGSTVIPLKMQAQDAFFVRFRRPAAALAASVAPRQWRTALQFRGAWDVAFQPGRGAPPAARLATLAPLSDSNDPGIRYFSGVATYTKTVRLGQPTRPLWLDLGKVGDIAQVTVNDKPAGTVWKRGDLLDLSGILRPGQNRIEVKVADLWMNRLIGDAQPGGRPIAFTTLPTYAADAPLRPSGLMGPVRLVTAE